VRLGKVNEEVRSMLIFDYVVVNHEDQLDATVDQIKAIVTAEKLRVNPRVVQFK
jgi:guanylate kinase